MQSKKVKLAFAGMLILAISSISACSAPASEPQDPALSSELSNSNDISKESTFNPNEYVSGLESEVKTVSPERLVEYYESQLDPEIPQITVMATITEGDSKTTCPLPYDASIRTSDEKTEMDREKTWFLNLMNNFWSLPILYDGYYELENWTEIPSHLSIQFEQPPEGEIVIKDYGIFDKYGVAVEADGFGNGWVGYIHTFEAAQELEFDLWLYDGIHLMSTQPELRGLRIECEIDGKQVEYYILFRSNYLGNIPFYGEDLSHLTPLQ